MKKKKYLPLYYKWVAAGTLPDHGLCSSLGWSNGRTEFTTLFQPRPECKGLWGYDGTNYIGHEIDHRDYVQIAYSFTPLRQNMLLLFAAMNNEL